MKIGFLLFAKWHQKKNIGSSRIRGEWIVNNWKEAELFQQGAKYSAIIFQKTFWLEYVKMFKGVKILDLCDPEWLDTVPVKEIMDNCDAITTSTEALAEEIRKFADKPVLCIPDRINLKNVIEKEHKDMAEKVCWFGYSHNTKVLDVAIPTIKRNKLKLTVISDFRPPYSQADENVKFPEDTKVFNKMVSENFDFAILPKDDRPRGKYKSNNKTVLAKSLGLPVATNPQEVERFLDPIERTKAAKEGLEEVKKYYDIRLSVQQYKDLIKKINDIR